jgi:hypothetical protein
MIMAPSLVPKRLSAVSIAEHKWVWHPCLLFKPYCSGLLQIASTGEVTRVALIRGG